MKSMSTVLSRVRGHWAGIQLLRDPSKLDQVFAIDAALPNQREVMARVIEAMQKNPTGAAALRDKPRLTVDLVALRALPEGTFGRAAAELFDRNKLDPKSIPTLSVTDEIEWAKAHLYETHDIWHVATGFSTDIAGELGLQAFYAAQLPGRLPEFLLAGGLLQSALWAEDDFRPRLASIVRGWELGLRAKPLFGVRWDKLWDVKLGEVRAELGL
jgi:ubiquinone biosynthesis protein Coq4